MRQYIFRTIVGVIGPIIVLCYLIFIWQLYLVPIDPDSSVAFGPPGAQWIFYRWFVAGIIGLNLSLYGLAGAEAGMLMEPFWRVNDAMGLMLHADNTWSKPSHPHPGGNGQACVRPASVCLPALRLASLGDGARANEMSG